MVTTPRVNGIDFVFSSGLFGHFLLALTSGLFSSWTSQFQIELPLEAKNKETVQSAGSFAAHHGESGDLCLVCTCSIRKSVRVCTPALGVQGLGVHLSS
jgi:hypothetical protein